jgi:hypothetical protein
MCGSSSENQLSTASLPPASSTMQHPAPGSQPGRSTGCAAPWQEASAAGKEQLPPDAMHPPSSGTQHTRPPTPHAALTGSESLGQVESGVGTEHRPPKARQEFDAESGPVSGTEESQPASPGAGAVDEEPQATPSSVAVVAKATMRHMGESYQHGAAFRFRPSSA